MGRFAKWILDWIVELLCDYGENVRRVMVSMAGLLLVGTLLLFWLGGLGWPEGSRALDTYRNLPPFWQCLHMLLHSLIYMLDTFTTANVSELQPLNGLVQVCSGLMAIVGIFLAGLLGFVAANRIRRS